MHNDAVVRFRKEDEVADPLTSLLRAGGRDLIQVAMWDHIRLTNNPYYRDPN